MKPTGTRLPSSYLLNLARSRGRRSTLAAAGRREDSGGDSACPRARKRRGGSPGVQAKMGRDGERRGEGGRSGGSS